MTASPLDVECAADIRSAVFALERALKTAQDRGLYVRININDRGDSLYLKGFQPSKLIAGDKLLVKQITRYENTEL